MSHPLTQFGVNPLTGEACAHNLRILCDLSTSGVTLLTQFLGVNTLTHALTPNWNSRVGERPAVASVMLPRETLRPLLVFALLQQGHDYVTVDDPTGYTQEEWDRYPGPKPAAIRNLGRQRNTHEMSGRTL